MILFGGDYESATYTYPVTNLVSESRRRQPLSRRELQDRARKNQKNSGTHIRVARTVLNGSDFGPELEAWHRIVIEKNGIRKSLGNLAVTLFDTSQTPLLNCPDHYDSESLKDRIEEKHPEYFQKTRPIAVSGTRLVGDIESGFAWVALTFDCARNPLLEERRNIGRIIAPELRLSDSHMREQTLHISLGQMSVKEYQRDFKDELESQLPEYVILRPATVEVTSRTNN
jgi:hypothetical protein